MALSYVGLTRREFMGRSGLLALGLSLRGARSEILRGVGGESSAKSVRYRIGVCDWMILKRQKLGAFALAKEIGVDGLEVDMGPLGQRETFESQLGDPGVQAQFLAKAIEVGVDISSLAMSGFYAQSFAERAGVNRMVQDCLKTMTALRVKVAFLPLGVQGDLRKHPELRPAVVTRLRNVGTAAAAVGVVVGIETALDAAAEAKLIDEVGSPAIRSYFNFANAIQAGRDVAAELETLGRDRLCQIHCTNSDGVWLQNDPQLDLARVKRSLDTMGWSGWLIMERSRDSHRTGKNDVVWNYGANAAYLKSVFQAA